METQPMLEIEEVRVARAAILDEDGRLLVLQRSDSDDYGAGQPDLPGGTLDKTNPRKPPQGAKRLRKPALIWGVWCFIGSAKS